MFPTLDPPLVRTLTTKRPTQGLVPGGGSTAPAEEYCNRVHEAMHVLLVVHEAMHALLVVHEAMHVLLVVHEAMHVLLVVHEAMHVLLVAMRRCMCC
jgi:hypothetical protein